MQGDAGGADVSWLSVPLLFVYPERGPNHRP